jgi:hypothetical protein
VNLIRRKTILLLIFILLYLQYPDMIRQPNSQAANGSEQPNSQQPTAN